MTAAALSSAAKSPAACERISRPKPNSRPNQPRPVSTTWTKRPVFGPALVQLAGRVEVARAEAVRDDAARLAGALDEGRELVLPGRVDERLDADVVAAGLRLGEQLVERAARPTSGSPAASTSFVLSFAACTSGWSNGLIPSTCPRRRSRTPSGRTRRRGRRARRARARRPGGRGRRPAPRAGTSPCPASRSTPRAAARPRDRSRSASRRGRPCRGPPANPPRAEAEPRGCRPRPAASDRRRRPVEEGLRSTPISAAATIPNIDSAE